jgi:LacI family transcriptional regulator
MSAPSARVTLRDVARASGVSPAAVSKVVRGAYGVSEQMRERVNAAIADLGYRPSSAARAMRGSSSTIGIELASLGNPFFAPVLDAIMSVVDGSRYQVMVAPSQSPEREGQRSLETLADHNVAGVIAVSPVIDQAWLEEYARAMPLVILGRDLAFDVVSGDDADGTRQVMAHLFERGHREIAHLTRSEAVTDPASGSPHARRLAGYLRAMEVAGLEARIARSGPREEDAFAVGVELLRAGTRPTAVFAANDALAFGMLRAIDQVGLTTREVAVVGYDDVPLARQPGVSLTSVDQNGEQMGRRAAELLISRLAGRTDPVREVVPVRLEARASTV